MRTHATEWADADETLCGLSLPRRIDNCEPSCLTCRRVIKSRCSTHNIKRCRRCGPSNRIVMDD